MVYSLCFKGNVGTNGLGSLGFFWRLASAVSSPGMVSTVRSSFRVLAVSNDYVGAYTGVVLASASWPVKNSMFASSCVVVSSS